eukprot:Awhi_evm1s4501
MINSGLGFVGSDGDMCLVLEREHFDMHKLKVEESEEDNEADGSTTAIEETSSDAPAVAGGNSLDKEDEMKNGDEAESKE